MIARKSEDASVTIPFERTFRELETPELITPLAPGGKTESFLITSVFVETFHNRDGLAVDQGVPTNLPTDARTNFCGCGWPDHFLVPRGAPSSAGMPFTLFAMATSWEEDRVVNETTGSPIDECIHSIHFI